MWGTSSTLRDVTRVIIFYSRGLPAFINCLFEPGLSLKFGHHARFGGEKLPYFFFGKSIPLSHIRIGDSAIEDDRAYHRIVEILKAYPEKPESKDFLGRDVERIWDLVEARAKGLDSFTVLVERTGRGSYRLIDGATRVALLAATGAENVSVCVTIRRP